VRAARFTVLRGHSTGSAGTPHICATPPCRLPARTGVSCSLLGRSSSVVELLVQLSRIGACGCIGREQDRPRSRATAMVLVQFVHGVVCWQTARTFDGSGVAGTA